MALQFSENSPFQNSEKYVNNRNVTIGESLSNTSFGIKQDLNTSSGLYNLAHQSELGNKADDIMRNTSGEEYKKIFSGGFVSDVFDVLNLASYGVVGTLKGQGFVDGIKSRASFSDDDALGRHGLMGVIGGVILDIATDPFTYIAPWTILKKVPGLAKVGKAVGEATIGKSVVREVGQDVERGLTRLVTRREGGVESLRRLAEKVVWMTGQDPVFREIYEEGQKNFGVQTVKAAEMMRDLGTAADFTPDIAKKLIVKDLDGRWQRQTIDALEGELSTEVFEKVQPIWQKMDDLGKELVDVGILEEAKFEENIGKYLKNAYEEYDVARKKSFTGRAGRSGISGTKKRVDDLTADQMAELRQIDNPSYLVFKSMLDMIKDVENGKMFNQIAERFGRDEALTGFTKIPDSPRFRTSFGKIIGKRRQIGEVNEQLKPLLANLKTSMKADNVLSRELDRLAKDIDSLTTKRAKDLTKFFNEGAVTTKTVTSAGRGLGKPLLEKVTDDLKPFVTKLNKYETYDDMINSADGLELEKLYHEGVLESNNFKSMRDFYENIKTPFKKVTTKEVEGVVDADMNSILRLQKKITQMSQKSKDLSEIDRRSIQDSMRILEKQVNDLRFAKDDLLEEINIAKSGELAGKYIPEEMAQYVNELVDVTNPFGSRLIGEFKFMKVIFSPATHARNIVSNSILNWWKLGIGPWRLDEYSATLKSIKYKDKWFREAQEAGMGANTYAVNELNQLLDHPDMASVMGNFGGKWGKVKHTLGDLYQQEENVAKLTAFRVMRKKGHSVDEAWKMAESATFNYAQVTPFIRKVRTSLFGVPFITFPLKAAPVVVETIGKNPHRVSFFQKFRTGMENLTDQKETEEEKAALPDYIKNGFYMKLPMKDKHGRSAYFDLTYIIPFGDLISGQFFERGTKRETGLPEGFPSALLSKNPVTNLAKELSSNRDFFGNKIFKDSDSVTKQLADTSNHIIKTFAPPWLSDQLPGGYKESGERQQGGLIGTKSADSTNQRRNIYQEILRNMGAKILPIDSEIQESIQESTRKKALRNLLQENGVVKEFSRTYQP